MPFKKVGKFLSSLLFPCFCVACSTEGSWWCASCQKEYSFLTVYTGNEAVGPIAGLTALFNYKEDDPPAKLIKALKYQSAKDSVQVWQKLFYDYFVSHTLEWVSKDEQIVLLPVPLHPRRERERGFNQSLLLAIQAAESLTALGYAARVEKAVLVRIKNTMQQARLGKEDRAHNLERAFIAYAPPPTGRIVLVDDVYTTGSTLSECARALGTVGIPKVWGLVGARG